MIGSVGTTNSVSQFQMAEMRQRMFSKIDTNGDGKHDKDELAAMAANGTQGGLSVDEILGKYDTDGDGSISEAEFQEGTGAEPAGPPPLPPLATNSTSTADFIQQLFKKNDTDSDGEVDADELAQMVANGPEGGPSAEALLSELDSDGNGSISQTEFEAAPKHSQQAQGPMGPPPGTDDVFSNLDADGDGTLSKAEFEAGFANSTEDASTKTGDEDSLVQMLEDVLKKYLNLSSASFNETDGQNLISSRYA